MDATKVKEELDTLYDDFVNGRITKDPVEYLRELQLYFTDGDLRSKVHSIELILNILIDRNWGQTYSSRSETVVSKADLILYKIDKVRRKLIGLDEPDEGSRHVDEAKKEAIYNRIKLRTIKWLAEQLTDDCHQSIFKSFYIFISTHWNDIVANPSPSNEELLKLHYKLMKSTHYAKWKAFERINQNAYSTNYKPPPGS